MTDSRWESRKASHVLDIVVGGTPPTDRTEYYDGDIPWLTIADLTSGDIIAPAKTLTPAGLAASGGRVLAPGTLLYSFKLSIGRTAFVETPVATNEAIAAILPSSKIDLAYARWALPGAFADAAGTNIYGAKILNQEQLKAARVPYPPMAQQRQIADYLDYETAEIDAFIADLRCSAELAVERTRALASTQLDEAVRDASRVTILGHVIMVNEGQVDPSLEQFVDLPLIAPNHIESRTGRLLRLESAREQGASSGKYQVRAGQVLYSKIRPALMKATIAPCDALCAADMYAMDARESWLSNDYLLEFLLSDRFEQYAVTMSDRVAMPKLNRDTLAHAPISLPTLADQDRAVSSIHRARVAQREAIADIDAAIALAKERRAALITAAVTGQIDVTARRKPVVDSIQSSLVEAR
ncbi:restriction endonuclease subunit S [Microbacterium oleivorans]|uniref:Restriction endonuclease subunit S n=1 Tax=Microbacterium oleivorans TaxID=273677 RepID=A0A7D5IXY9_9MICO|nr:restriction endonuclease subunit S [Microbacterium oleivorans]QLD10815.1 restriction endonuclease subunit S [Microbacterium oleivorans]